MPLQHIFNWIILTAWLVLLVVWAISAFFAKPYAHRGRGWVWRFVAVVILTIALHFNLPLVSFIVPGSAGAINAVVGWLGCIVCVGGVILALWARFYLGRNWGMPMSLKQGAELVTSGPYAYIRNPIYTGILMAMLGAALAVTMWWLVSLIVFGTYFIWSSKAEETIMNNEFPTTYPAYKARTKMLIPWVL